MPRFFLHLKQGSRLVRDQEGSVLRSVEDAHAWATKSAREICAEAIKYGTDIFIDVLVIADESGERITFLPITDVLPARLRSPMPQEMRGVVTSTAHDQTFPALSERTRHLRAEITERTNSCNSLIREIKRQVAAL